MTTQDIAPVSVPGQGNSQAQHLVNPDEVKALVEYVVQRGLYHKAPEAVEQLVSVPDALFKIVVREPVEPELSGIPMVLAFIYPQINAGYRSRVYNHKRYLPSVDEIESLTGLDFLTVLDDQNERGVESEIATELWPVGRDVPACRR